MAHRTMILAAALPMRRGAAPACAARRSVTGMAVLALAAAAAAVAGCEDPSIKFNQHGLAYYAAGDYTHARAAFEEATRLNPDVGKYYFNRGTCEQALGNWDAAIFNYEMAQRLSPGIVEAFNNQARCLLEKGQPEQAQQALVTGTVANPYNGDAFVNVAKFFEARADMANARLWMAKGVAADPDNAGTHLEFANFLLKTGEREKAIEEYRKSLYLNPVQPEVSAKLSELSPAGTQLPPPKPQTQ